MPDTSISLCPECGKQQPSDNITCWLCGRKLGVENRAGFAAANTKIIEDPNPGGSDSGPLGPIIIGLLLGLWVLVGVGFLASSILISTFYFGITVVAGATMMSRMRQPKETHDSTDVLIRFVQIMGVVAMLAAGLFIALLLVCMSFPLHVGP